MDPNETLKTIRSIKELSDEVGLIPIDQYQTAMELFDALDEWLSKGGFLPTDWERK